MKKSLRLTAKYLIIICAIFLAACGKDGGGEKKNAQLPPILPPAPPPLCQIRFTDNGDGTIKDCTTSMVWQKGQSSILNWSSAVSYCNSLTLASRTWKAPTKEELEGLFAQSTRSCGPSAGGDFIDVYLDPIFTCNGATVWSVSECDVSNATFVDFASKASTCGSKTGGVFNIRCVASASCTTRYKDNGDGTITDCTTGLVWQKGQSSILDWSSAVSYCDSLTLGGSSNWRAPTKAELEGLFAQNTRSCGPSAGGDFTDVYLDPIFTCNGATVWSVSECDVSDATFVDFASKASTCGSKTGGVFNIRCVR